jgi:hypothetical protein
MSLGYDGADAGSVHPHERAVDMTPEADRRMGVRKAEGWRKGTQVPASLVRQCRWPTADGVCHRFFVATKRQKWCPMHQDAARRERDRKAHERSRARKATGKSEEEQSEEEL